MELFNREKVEIANLTLPEIEERRNRLQVIINEAKIRTAADDDEIRSRKAKLSKAERDSLISNVAFDVNQSDKAQAVKKQRMSKADKLAANLASIGLGNDDEVLAKVERKLTGNNAITSSKYRFIPSKPPIDRTDEAIEKFNNGEDTSTKKPIKFSNPFSK